MLKSKKGLRQPTCLGCIPIEAACFLYGIVSCVLSIFGILILALARTFVPYATIESPGEMFPDLYYDGGYNSLPLAAYAMFLYITYIGSFAFSVLLCYGIHRRSPGYLKAYLVYGITVTAVMLLSLLYFYPWLYSKAAFSFVGIACCIYLVVLRVVHQTHQMFRAERSSHMEQLRGYME